MLTYRDFGRTLTAKGWSSFPQERDGEKRGPARYLNRGLKIYEEYKLDLAPPKLWHVEDFEKATGRSSPYTNTAIVLGKQSGAPLAIDIDVTIPEVSNRITEIARATLGDSRLERVGRAPKRALFYRWTGTPQPTSTHVIADLKDVDGDRQMVEILSNGGMMTCYGLHHKSKQPFTWVAGAEPMDTPVADLIAVSPEQVEAFLAAIDAEFPFVEKGRTAVDIEAWGYSASDDIYVPSLKSAGAAWIEEDGLISDGREAYLFALATEVVRGNAGVALADGGEAKMCAVVYAEFEASALCDRNWSGRALQYAVRTKVRDRIAKLRKGTIKPRRMRRRADAIAGHQIVEDASGDIRLAANRDPDLATKPGAEAKPRAPIQGVLVKPADRERAAQRALIQDRTIVTGAVSDDVEAAIRQFLDRAFVEDPAGDVMILKAPAGAGKTTATLRLLGNDRRVLEGRGQGSPIIFALPTYNNISEAEKAGSLTEFALYDERDLRGRATIDGEFDEALFDQIAEGYARAARRQGVDLGLRIETYKGKVRAGCLLPDQMSALQKAGLDGSSLCKADVRDPMTGDFEERRCPHYDSCPAIAQLERCKHADIVMIPHAFLSLPLPKVLQDPRAVIIDERMHSGFLHTAELSTRVIDPERPVPRTAAITKDEKAKGITSEGFEAERGIACQVADQAIKGRRDIAGLFYALDGTKYCGREKFDAGSVIRAAKRCCSGAAAAGKGAISPGMPQREIDELVARPRGEAWKAEFRFWKLVEERFEALKADQDLRVQIKVDEALLPGIPDQEATIIRKKIERLRGQMAAKGDRDARIEILMETDDENKLCPVGLRLSWRSKPNWVGKPTLILDASADAAIIKKIYSTHAPEPDLKSDNNKEPAEAPKKIEVKVTSIKAPLHIKTVAIIDHAFAKSGFTGENGPGRIADVRRAIVRIASHHAGSRVLVGCAKEIRILLNAGWAAPVNVDFCHFGAMRGLDFAKSYGAAVSIGSMQLPVDAIDGYVAALTYNDDTPEGPLQPHGVDKAIDAKGDATGGIIKIPTQSRTLQLRDGADLEIEISNFSDEMKWHKAIQEQFREEEQAQFLGRLRPVYRTGSAPVWYCLGNILPEGVIVDDVLKLADFLIGDAPIVPANAGGGLPARDPDDIEHYLGDLAARRRLEVIWHEIVTAAGKQATPIEMALGAQKMVKIARKEGVSVGYLADLLAPGPITAQAA